MKNARSLACINVSAPFGCHILDQVLQATAQGRSLVTVTQVFIRVFFFRKIDPTMHWI